MEDTLLGNDSSPKPAYYVVESVRAATHAAQRYPDYPVVRSFIGAASSLDAAEAIIRADIGDVTHPGYQIHSFRVRKYHMDHYVETSDDTQAEYVYDRSGRLLDKREHPFWDGDFKGRDESECRFRPGDLCEVVDGDTVRVAIVEGLPLSRERVRAIASGNGGVSYPDSSDDAYSVVYNCGGKYIADHIDVLRTFPTSLPVHPQSRRALERVLADRRTEPVRFAIRKTALLQRIQAVLDELGLNAEIYGPDYEGDVMGLHFFDGLPNVPGGAGGRISLYVCQGKAERHTDMVRVGLSRLCGKDLPGRGFRLKPGGGPIGLYGNPNVKYYHF